MSILIVIYCILILILIGTYSYYIDIYSYISYTYRYTSQHGDGKALRFLFFKYPDTLLRIVIVFLDEQVALN